MRMRRRPALSSYDRIYWIAGGLPKEGGITTLRRFFPKIAKAYLIGEAAPAFRRDARRGGALSRFQARWRRRWRMPQQMPSKDDKRGASAVMLSPACASFDQYKNFEIRGDAFVAHVARSRA